MSLHNAESNILKPKITESVGTEFKVGDSVVYPAHGVGEIIEVETESIAGISIQVYVVSFPHDKMVLRVPVKRAIATGLRALVSKDSVAKIYKVLQGRVSKITNKMWNRRAQEYEAKINSGDITAVAEVIRDLHKDSNTDRSYSERTIYESALNRLAGELAALENITVSAAVEKLASILDKESVA
jgi:CarD family transcriptional regulator